MQLTVDVPDGAFSSLRLDPRAFVEEMCVVAAASWYQQGRVSQEVAASIAGMNRTDFLLTLARMGIDSFHVDLDELERELSRE